MNKLIIFGIGDFANQLFYYLNNDSSYEVVAFCADKKYIDKTVFNNLPVYAFEEINNFYKTSEVKFLAAIGYSNMRAREKIYNKIIQSGFDVVNYISSNAIISKNVELGFNNIIFQGVVIEQNAVIGNNNIIWSSSVICHDVKLGNHNFIAAGSIIGGYSQVKNLCFLGFNSTVVHNIIVNDETLVGANSLLLNSTMTQSKWLGSPAKCHGFHSENGIKVQ